MDKQNLIEFTDGYGDVHTSSFLALAERLVIINIELSLWDG